jgi:NifU-like protein
VGEAALICTCFGVTDDRIREMIASRRARTVRQVGELTNAGTGCGSCQMLIREILDGAESESEEFAAS